MLTKFQAGWFGAALVAVVLFGGADAFAGEGCCPGEGGGQVVEKGGGEKVEKKDKESCSLAECDKELAAKTEAVLAKLSAPAPKLSAEDEKALGEASQTLVSTCPMGQAFTASLPTIVEGLEAIRALDAALEAGGKDLPADCKTEDGKCAFCVEIGSTLPKESFEGLGTSGQAIERAHKLALKLATIGAQYEQAGAPTTKPAGSPAAIPSKETYAALAKRIEAAAAAIVAAQEKAEKLAEADQKKIEECMAKIEKIAPGSFDTMWAGWKALFAEIHLANKSVCDFEEKSGLKANPKLVEGASTNAKNAFALFTGRAEVIRSLGKVVEAACSSCCEEKEGCDEASKPIEK